MSKPTIWGKRHHLFQGFWNNGSMCHRGKAGRSAKGSDRLPLERAAGDISLALHALRI